MWMASTQVKPGLPNIIQSLYNIMENILKLAKKRYWLNFIIKVPAGHRFPPFPLVLGIMVISLLSKLI